jgi:hypothetical protein
MSLRAKTIFRENVYVYFTPVEVQGRFCKQLRVDAVEDMTREVAHPLPQNSVLGLLEKVNTQAQLSGHAVCYRTYIQHIFGLKPSVHPPLISTVSKMNRLLR